MHFPHANLPSIRRVVLDIAAVARGLTEDQRVEVEAAAAGAEATRAVQSHALAVPTGAPLSMFDARSWTASFTEFWYGDGVPFLQRDRALTFEHWAAALLEREELQYDCPLGDDGFPLPPDGRTTTQCDVGPGDAAPPLGVAFCAPKLNRFLSEDMMACVGSAVRRLAELLGTRAMMRRPGFFLDVKALHLYSNPSGPHSAPADVCFAAFPCSSTTIEIILRVMAEQEYVEQHANSKSNSKRIRK